MGHPMIGRFAGRAVALLKPGTVRPRPLDSAAPRRPKIYDTPPIVTARFAAPLSGVRLTVSIQIDVARLAGWTPEQIVALLDGIGKCVVAGQPETETLE